MLSFAVKLIQCRRGAAAIEYALLVALIAVAVIAALRGVGGNVGTTVGAVSNEMPGASAIVINTMP